MSRTAPDSDATQATVQRVTERIIDRSAPTRKAYLERMRRAQEAPRPERSRHDCSNLAHGLAACSAEDKSTLRGDAPNIGIVTAYNDMLSAHQPYASYPDQIKQAVAEVGAVAQVAGGVPAMCDGVTQGRAGMELSLFSRDIIALSTAIAMSHEMFDAAVCFGICDKIVPGELIGALSFGHLPFIWVPAGPMPSGLSNKEKASIRQRFATGDITREELLDAESAAYHSPGTCTFYGTANSNQMFMEVLGLQLPGSSFVNPDTALRTGLTRAAAHRAVLLAEAAGRANSEASTGLLGQVVSERAMVNAIVGLLATGGSTNHTIHLVAIARAAGVLIDWNDFDELSSVTPLLTRIYPNGIADVNHFHRAGGMACLIGELLDAGLLHDSVETIMGPGLDAYTRSPELIPQPNDEKSNAEEDERSLDLVWTDVDRQSSDSMILRPHTKPFRGDGGLRVLEGNLGRAILKTSSIPDDRYSIQAQARVFDDQSEVQKAFDAGELDRDVVVVVRFQGPQANGMPELHKLMPPLGVLQDRGFRVSLLTDGRLSGASGKVPAALHVVPEAANGGLLARLNDGDEILVDAAAGKLEVLVESEVLNNREAASQPADHHSAGVGRELFAGMRAFSSGAEQGASSLGWIHPELGHSDGAIAAQTDVSSDDGSLNSPEKSPDRSLR